jgi:hypothetical protein
MSTLPISRIRADASDFNLHGNRKRGSTLALDHMRRRGAASVVARAEETLIMEMSRASLISIADVSHGEASEHGPRPTFLSLVGIDPLLQLKASPAVSARRARMTKIVKGILGIVTMLGVVALLRVAFASSADDSTQVASESTSDSDRVVRGVETLAAKGPNRREALRSTPRSTRASLSVAGGKR